MIDAYRGPGRRAALGFSVWACGGDGGATPVVDAGGDARMTPVQCDVDGGASCDNGVHCDGVETCDANDPSADPVTHCVAGSAVVCDDDIECTRDRCDENIRGCTFSTPDADNDGHGDIACLDHDGEPLGDDCDDNDETRNPGRDEVCTPETPSATHDEDCDPNTFGWRDLDGDGLHDARCMNFDEAGTRHAGDDCLDDPDVDGSHNVFAGAPEICDALDNDCDTDHAVDESPQNVAWYPDTDGDRFGRLGATPIVDCEGPEGYEMNGTDCDDDNPGINPGNAEMCNGIDDDCDMLIDDGLFCGTCMCSLPNVAAVACTAGATACTVGVCNPTFLNCDSNQQNGCESDRTSDTSCGQCGRVCPSGASCVAGGGSYDCACDDGYTGDGVTCTDIDECLVDNGGCGSTSAWLCTNTVGGRTCTDINECIEGTDTCIENDSVACENTSGGFTCACALSHRGTYPSCFALVVSNGTVTDQGTGRVWQQHASTITYTWSNAQAYCANLSLAGTGWRMPTAGELRVLVDVRYQPTIDPVAFAGENGGEFWTSTLSDSWYELANFTTGERNEDLPSQSYRVRCVR